jgi:drug/metabolite transporter (DMT)-like permease
MGISSYLYKRSTEVLGATNATTIRSLGFVVTILLAIFISQEKLSAKDWISVVFAVIAVLLFGSTEP